MTFIHTLHILANASSSGQSPTEMSSQNGRDQLSSSWQRETLQGAETNFQNDVEPSSPVESETISEYALRLHDVETQSVSSSHQVKSRIVAERVE